MDRTHEMYLLHFLDELFACGYSGPMTPAMVSRLTELANNGLSAVQSAQIIYLELLKKEVK